MEGADTRCTLVERSGIVKKKQSIVEVQGVHGRFRAYSDDLITNQIVQFGAHTRNEIAMILDHIDQNSVCIDLGAHIGTFSVAIGQKIGVQGRLLAIEGNQETHGLLAHNVGMNGLADRIVAIEAIVGDGTSRNLTRHEKAGNTGAGYYAPDNEAELIPTQDAALLFEEKGFGEPDFIKMDIEGMEAIVLRNIASIIEASKPVLYIEIAADQLNRFNDTPTAIEKQLKAHGYRFYRNASQRNSKNDDYQLREVKSLASIDRLFDLLALPKR